MDPIMITQCNDWLFSGRNALWIHLFGVFLHLRAYAQIDRNSVTRHAAVSAADAKRRSVGATLLNKCCMSVFHLKWKSSSKYSWQKSKYTDIPIERTMSDVSCHQYWQAWIISVSRYKSPVGGPVGLMAKLETAGFAEIQTYSETLLCTASCRSIPKINISKTKHLLVYCVYGRKKLPR